MSEQLAENRRQKAVGRRQKALRQASNAFLFSAFCLRWNEQLPLDLSFQDEHGQTVKLGQYFDKKPVVLALVYYNCPMLCTQILNGMVGAFKVMSFTPGTEFEVVTV